MKNFRWRFSCIILSVIQLDTMWAFLARFFFGRSQPLCSVGFRVRLSARASLVLVLGGFLTTKLHTIRVCTSPGFLHVKISVSYLGYTSNGHLV